MAYQLSPGINVSEIDLTGIIPSVGTTEGGFAGNFRWGPVDEIVTVNNEQNLLNYFGKPDANNFVDWFTCANFLAYARNLKIVRSNYLSKNAIANTATTAVTIKNETQYEEQYYDGSGDLGSWAARFPGALGNSLRVSICPTANAFTANLEFTGSGNVGSNVVTLSGSAASDGYFKVVAGDFISIGGSANVQVVSVQGANLTLASALSANYSGNTVMGKWQYADEFSGAPGTSTYVSNRGGANDEMHIIVVDEDGQFTGVPNTVLEKYEFVSKASDAISDDGSARYYRDVIKESSQYVYWMDHKHGANNWGNPATGTTFTKIDKNEYSSLGLGTDVAPSTANNVTAYNNFKNQEEIDVSLMLTAAHGATVASHIIQNICEYRNPRDVIAFISPERADVVNNRGSELVDVIEYRNSLPSSSYGIMDCNWKYQFDRFYNVYRWVPLNGDIAGLVVRTDFERDPWFSPAGYNRGGIKNVIKLAWNPNKTDRDELYKKGINPVITSPGEGTILFGDKTLLSKPSAFDRINVRRLFIVLEKAIARAAKYTLFEFNDEFTRSQFVAMTEPYLRDVKGRRGIYDFRVVCDTTNNTPEVIDRNEFVADIYIKPARSINFIQLNFIATRTGVSFDEIVGNF